MSRFQYPSIPTLPEQAGTKFSEPETVHRLAWRDTPINQLSRKQMIECIEGLDRDVQACRAERDEYLDKWQATERAFNRMMDEGRS